MTSGMSRCASASTSFSAKSLKTVPQRWQKWGVSHRHTRSRNSNHHRGICTRAIADLQDVIVGGAVLTAVSAALYNGLKGEPQVCDFCQGVGGAKCFACDGSGGGKSQDTTGARAQKRDFVGRVMDTKACRVCGGSGMNLCSKCKGSGYL